MVSDSGEATLPDPVPLHQRGWGRGRHPSAGVCGAHPAASEELFLSPTRLIAGEAGLFGCTYLCVSKPCATEIRPFNRLWAVSRKGSNAPALKKNAGGQKATPSPPPLIIGGAGVTQAAATGAYKDLCAGKGIRLRPRTEEGRSALAQFAQPRVWAIRPGRRVRSAGGPRDPGRLVTRRFGAGKVCQKQES